MKALILHLLPLLMMMSLHPVMAQNLSAQADSLYAARDYEKAAGLYSQTAERAEFRGTKASHYYNAACCYALEGKKDSAYFFLEKAKELGWKNKTHLLNDGDLVSLHHDKKWKRFVKKMKPASSWTSNPLKAKLVTTDIDHFWEAYDRAQKDTASRLQIYREYYINRGTDGLQDYFSTKVGNMKSFIRGHDHHARFYAAIRANTLGVKTLKPRMIQSFVQFKELYPPAKFPPVYFVIGNFTSGGTVSQNGLLIGTDQMAKSPDIPLDELNLWERNVFAPPSSLPHIIAHELIHFNQKLASDTTLLAASLLEGMCDFFAVMISGNTSNERLHQWAKGKEKMIWAEFKKEMWLNRGKNWIANANRETADRPADLGYWVGYMICKSYYDHAPDKKQAVSDILNIKDFRKFYEMSQAEAMFEAFPAN